MKTNQKKRYYDDQQTVQPNKNDNNANQEVEVFHIKANPKNFRIKNIKQHHGKVKEKIKRFPGKTPLDPAKLEKHSRGEGLDGKGVMHPLHLEKLKKRENKFNYAQDEAARAEILQTEEKGTMQVQGQRTVMVTQQMIANEVDLVTATKIFDLSLDFGPYTAKYSRNGRHLLLGGRKGHVAGFDWVTKKLHFEMNVMESIHDVSWLHIETMLAVAQKEWVYIYDNTGIELHCLKQLNKVQKMEFLPYHFLLAVVNEYGYMSWLDVSMGKIVGHYNNGMGHTEAMTQNPYNATLCLGGSKGVVSMWSPTVKKPLAKILCHKTPVTGLAVDKSGMYMATSGVDRSMKIWDIRHLDGPLQDYRLRTPPAYLEFSQKNMLAVGLGNNVEIYSDCCTKSAKRPYMRHKMAKTVHNFKFCPYEDVLGIGTSKGFTSIVVPGSGEPNFDALENNPFQNKKQRKEAEVKALLEKIPPELITLNPLAVTEVDVPSLQEQMEAKKKLLYVKPKTIDITPRHKKKGKTNIARKKIIREAVRKEFIEQSLETKKLLGMEEQNAQKQKQTFGVLDRLVPKYKSSKK